MRRIKEATGGLADVIRGVVAIVSCVLAVAASADGLPPAVDRILRGHHISPDDVSIVVHAIDAPSAVLEHLPDEPRNPASVMKLVTTWSALEILGPAYTWRTEVYLDGELDDGKLDGDLVLKGYGDPFLVLEEFWKLLRAVRRLGVDEIGGDLVIDDSYFAVDEPPPGEFDNQPTRTYNVVPNALLVNFKAVNFQFIADPAANQVRVTYEPPLPNLEVKNGIRLASGACGGYQAGISLDVLGARLDEVRLGGAFPSRCGSYSMTRTVLEHDTYVFGLFDALWKEIGGRFDGRLRKGRIDEAARPVLTWRSPPLADIVRSINKNSNNVMTRQLLYTLGAETAGAPGTRENGAAAVRDFLAARGLDTRSLVIDNGAGLSREARVSARLVVDILRAAAASPYAGEFVSSLALGGLDGTTRTRFNGSSAVTHVKTGRLDHVSALAGYVRSARGTDYAIAVIANAQDVHRGPGHELEEAVVRFVHDEL
ncbi:MAG TPA: D-alanyl-D-alanine carboxypeptidase/D-alanyl-D-alanine-endopeptidase [Gammaproteobacteria bacterium]